MREEITEVRMDTIPASTSPAQEVDNTELGKKAEDDFDHLLNSVRISATSRALGFFWFILTYLFAPEPPSLLIPAIILVGIIGWCAWEFYWHLKWKHQEKDAVNLMNSFRACLPTSNQKQLTEILKSVQQLASDVANHTSQTPIR